MEAEFKLLNQNLERGRGGLILIRKLWPNSNTRDVSSKIPVKRC